MALEQAWLMNEGRDLWRYKEHTIYLILGLKRQKLMKNLLSQDQLKHDCPITCFNKF